VYAAVVEMRNALKTLRQAKRELDTPMRAESDPQGDLGTVLQEASAEVTAAFRSISPSTAVASITLELGEATTMQLAVRATSLTARRTTRVVFSARPTETSSHF
jgi:hypothetical protein